MTNEEQQALCRVARILARNAAPNERQNIATNMTGNLKNAHISLPQAAILFWPDDAERQTQTLELLNRAVDAGELGPRYAKAMRVVPLTSIGVWLECPPMAADTPLRHWAPDAPEDEPQAAAQETAAAGTPRKWTTEARRALADYREKHGTEAAAKHFGITGARVRKLLPGEKAPTKKATWYSTITHHIK